MTLPDKRVRPAGNRADHKIQQAGESGSSVPAPADILIRARRHDHALLVTSQRADGVLVSQLYTSMHPAERKLARCRERGLPASITLVRLVPVASAVEAVVADE